MKKLCILPFVLCISHGAFAQSKHLTLLGVSSATAARKGSAFVSVAAAPNPRRYSEDVDVSAALGLGFGDAEKAVGGQVTTVFTSLADDFGESGYASLKLSRRIADGTVLAYAGLSFERVARWGEYTEVDPRAKAIVSFFPHWTAPSGEIYPLALSVGVGNDIRNNNTDPALFAGMGIGITSSFGASAAWTGETATLGVSFQPPNTRNFMMTASVNDVFDDTQNRRLNISMSWVFRNVLGE